MLLRNFFLDAKAKLIIVVVNIFFIASIPNGKYPIFGAYFVLAFIVGLIFKPSIKRLLKRTFLVFLYPLFISIFIPFVNEGNTVFELNLGLFNLTITDNGISTFLSVILKSFLSVLLLASLITSTDEREILHGLRKMYIPKIIVSIIFLMYRYIFLAREEFRIGMLAIESRIFPSTYRAFNKKLSFLFGNLLIKSIDRAENVYKSMETRGFDGNFYVLERENGTPKSAMAFLAAFVLMLLSIKLIELFNIM